MQAYKALIFDFDGVILDSVEVKTSAFAQLYEEYGDEVVAKVIQHHLSHGGVSRFEKFRWYHKEFLGKEVSQDELDALCSRFNELVFAKVIASPYIPGAKEFIVQHSRTHDLFICTGTPEREIHQILEEIGLSQYFKRSYGSPDDKITIVDNILKEFTYTPDQICYFGDATTDYEAAIYHHIGFIGIINGKFNPFPPETIVLDSFLQNRASE